MITWFLPNEYVSSIFDIDYNKLYEDGKRLILTDLDNTLISYLKTEPDDKLFEWKKEKEAMGFEIIIVSNSRKDRVEHFANLLDLKFQKFAKKPLVGGLKKAIKKGERDYKKEEIIVFGDQLMTDIFGSKRLGLDVYLVQAIDKKTEYFTTRFNRRLEKKMLKKIKRKYPELYKEKLERYERENQWL